MPLPPSCDVIVIGAGVAGLFCATALADAGLRVGVLEARASAGGRARSWVDQGMGIEVDIGPHVVSSEHVNFMRMLRRLGTADAVNWQADTMVSLLDARELLDVPNVRWTPPLHGLPVLPVALRRLGLADALSHWRLAWQAARVTEAGLRSLDGTDALSWLRGLGVSPRAIDWFWRSAMLALLNLPLEQCSAASTMRIFRLMLGRSGYHFGFPTTGLSGLYVPQCTAAIRAAGGDVLTGSPVHRLHVQDGSVRGVHLRNGALLRAPWCVLAVAPWNAAPLLARTRDPRLALLEAAARRFLGAPYTSTVLALDRRLGERRFWARVWNPDDLNTDFYDLANIRPELAGGGSVIAANAIGPNASLHWSDAQVIARTMAELEEFTPAARGARVLGACVHRIRAAIPQPRPGTEVLRPGTRTAVGGLLLAGDWTDTAVPCSMESAARSGALAAEAILGKPLALPAPETYGLVGLLRAAEPATERRGTDEALARFDALQPVDTRFMLGTWDGEEYPTGHPLDGALAAYGWRGKRFDSEEHAHPLLFAAGMREFAVRPRWAWPGVPLVMRWSWLKSHRIAKVVRSLLPLLATQRSQARLRTVEFRGRPGAAMVYDDLPIQDVFRRIDDDTVLGLMDCKGMERPFFFILRRRRDQRVPSP